MSANTSTSYAVLLDHGPSDPQLTWPQWYRDTNGLALGLCTSQELSTNAAAGNAPMCFPPAPEPDGFAGNVGSEMFYNMVEFREKATGSDFKFRYVAGLEASYLPLGVPVHGTELVFARVRIALNFNDSAKNGTYTVTHPFGVEVFNNVKATNNQNLFGAHAAVFFTADVPLGPEMNFDGALGGALGPFIGWDVLEPGESLTVNGTNFLGDPNYAHTFTGSPYGTNYIRIQGPPGSNLDGLGNDFIQTSVANVLGQVWGAPIAQPLSINSAYKSRSAGVNGKNSIDVWATSSPNQKLILTGTGMPSLQLFPDGVVPGKYHGHIEYPSNISVPASVTVTNVDSNPIVSQTTALKDGVEISVATFNTNTGDITVVATSSDKVGIPTLAVQGIPGIDPAVSTIMTTQQCLPTGLATKPDDVCYVYALPAGIEPPETISVASSDLGAHSDILLTIVGNPQNKPNPPIASDFAGANGFTVSSTGSTPLVNAAGTALPTDALIVSSPASGNIALIGGAWTFTPTAGALAGPDNFQFVRQDPATLAVSNVAIGELALEFQSAAPTANLDQFAALVANPRLLNVLKNDKSATTNATDQINVSSVVIVTPPTRGTATKNADGTISYTATAGGSDSFAYKVANNAGQESNVATVQLTNFTGPESVSVGKVTYTASQTKWVIVGSTNWFGPNLTQTTATCWTGTAAAPTASTLISSALIDTTGKFQIQFVGAPAGVNNQRVSCQTSNGGKGLGTTSAK
ncbi:MAG: Ig-like domain-containing protein [Methylococcaceae bacterium]|nr:Ig-like domain-containing protein [Methylococcaceae bacterium]